MGEGEEAVYKNHKFQTYYVLLMTLNVTVLMFATFMCVCCKRRKFPKNELLGLEGKVKLNVPEEVVIVGVAPPQSESQADLNLSTTSNADSEKRASTAAHRSLPDIPVNDDNGSELYETVAEKQLVDDEQSRHNKVMTNLKKQSSVSQHSSISQADDSPYSRVKNSPHDYAKVRATEHPYAQLNAPSTSLAAASTAPTAVSSGNISATTATTAAVNNNSQITLNESVHRSSHHSNSSQSFEDAAPQAEIPAASAIAGMVSASQDLPYMTPPIANQHFSGDSQDSSKGYTSISVREPLANILAQQPAKSTQRIPPLSRDVNDSHYATVSDDSDETYAAIEDPSGRIIPNPTSAADIYTSGSETYAQIQPMQSNSIVVSVEINSASPSTNSAVSPIAPSATINGFSQLPDHNHPISILAVNRSRPNSDHATPVPPPVDSLRAQMHSRQASSSSNNSSSVGNLGSPKPEKRQANSPLPPTPKSSASHGTSTSNLTSGRNSVISVIELGTGGGCISLDGSNSTGTDGSSPQKKTNNHKSLSPSKDIEGMYAKVIKKSKFSNNSPSSQDNSPIMTRKYDLGITPLDPTAAELMNAQKITMSSSGVSSAAGSVRTRSNSYGAKDHGYETIPADNIRNATGENRKSDGYAHILQKERQQEGAHHHAAGVTSFNYSTTQPPSNYDQHQRSTVITVDKHYETIASARIDRSNLDNEKKSSDYDPNYETLQKPKTSNLDNEKKSSDYDPNYEVLQEPKHTQSTSVNSAGLSDDGYAKVLEKKRVHMDTDSVDGYSKVRGEYGDGDADSDAAIAGYSTIGEVKGNATESNHNYASISEAKQQMRKIATDTESDHYARIAESHDIDLPLSGLTTPAKTPGDDDVLSPRIPDVPVISPSSVNNSSLASSSSLMNINNTTASTSTMSSRQTPSSSQYESLTGSETDAAYESVSYANTTTTTSTTTGTSEHPYERLQPDNSDSQLSSSALTTPEEQHALITKVSHATANGTKPVQAATATTTTTTIELSTDVVVDDYFQV